MRQPQQAHARGMLKADESAPRGVAAQTHALSITDAYFVEELTASVGYAEAARWLDTHAHGSGARCRRSMTVSSSPMTSISSSAAASPSPSSQCSPRRPNEAPLPGALSSGQARMRMAWDMSELAMGLGADRGLLYTDAAHMVLEGSLQKRNRHGTCPSSSSSRANLS